MPVSGIFAVRSDPLLTWVATPPRAPHVAPGGNPCGLIAPVAGRTGLLLRTAPQLQHAVLLTGAGCHGGRAALLLTIKLLISRRARPGSECRRPRDNRYLDAAVDHLRALAPKEREHDGLDEEVARVAALKHADLNCLDRYSFAARPPCEGLCPLRDPATVHVDEDDEDTGE